MTIGQLYRVYRVYIILVIFYLLISEGRKEGNVLFNDTLILTHLGIYSIGHN